MQDPALKSKYAVIGDKFQRIVKICLAISPRIHSKIADEIKEGLSTIPPLSCLSRDLYELLESATS